MLEDAELLRRYAEERSESAFAELVRRRVDLVYSVALRRVGGDAHLAEDVTQRVFTDLARKAPQLTHRPALTGWLCRSAQFAGSDAVRSERRRRAREQESHAMDELSRNAGKHTDWNKVRPLLDEALGDLNDADRDAVALRFLEDRPFAEVGERLRVSEEAARKRVDRALEKMAAALSRRGVTSTTAALGAALATHITVAAPAGLAGSVTAASLAVGAASGASTGLLAFFGLTTGAKITLSVLGVATAVASGVAWHEARESRANRAALAAARQAHAGLRSQVHELRAQVRQEQRRAQAAEEDSARLLAAIEQARHDVAAAHGARGGEIPRETVEARYKKAQDLMSAGRWDAALTELLWCYDDGMTRNSSFSGLRLSVLLGDIARIAPHFPPASTALRERRARAEQRLLTSAGDEGAAHEFASLNRALGESARTLDVYDRLPADDPRRRRLVLAGVFQLLVNAQRYADAIQAVPYERMVPWFERESRPPDIAHEDYPEMALKRHRRIVVDAAARSVEVLAGAGELDRAREFVGKVLAFDGSAETRELLQRHATRAGHPELLEVRAAN